MTARRVEITDGGKTQHRLDPTCILYLDCVSMSGSPITNHTCLAPVKMFAVRDMSVIFDDWLCTMPSGVLYWHQDLRHFYAEGGHHKVLLINSKGQSRLVKV